LPAEGKKAIEEWMQNYRNGCENLKRLADDGYQMIEKYLSQAAK
jgi:hypothetical protein